MDKSFGDAFVLVVQTRIIHCLTCNVHGAAFLRVMHLVTGDYILIGPDHFEDIRISHTRDNELWFLSKEPGSKPVKMNMKLSEGSAISKKSMKVSYSVLPPQDSSLAPEASRMEVAEVSISGGQARLINRRVVYESKDAGCKLESQDFYDNDTKMTFTCYEPKGLLRSEGHNCDACAHSDAAGVLAGKFRGGFEPRARNRGQSSLLLRIQCGNIGPAVECHS